MSLTIAEKQSIESCLEYQARNMPDAAAKIFSNILAAEEECLIGRTWRKDINTTKLNSFIEQNNEKIEKEWEREFNQLKPITDYGGYMEYEEMSLILSLRSDLLSLSRFLSDEFLGKYEKQLEIIDEDLISVLTLNKNHARDSRNSNRKHTGGIETYLPKHWWWRYDEEH